MTARTALLALLAIAVAGGTTASAAGGGAVSVSIVGRAYQPAELTVGLGQTVTWRNESLSTHTVTSPEGLFGSGVINIGTSFSVTFSKAGTFDYMCTIHPTMHGSVVVLAIAPGTVQLHLTGRRRGRGETVTAHVLAARGEAGVLLQASGSGGRWRTLARSRLDSEGESVLKAPSAARQRLRVVVLAADGAPRLVSQVVRAPA